MSTWNKVLIGLILIAVTVFFYLGARTLDTHKSWREKANNAQQEIEALEAERVALVEGSEELGMGIREARRELHKVLVDRGRVWYHCRPGKFDPKTGAGSVTTDLPTPHKITDKMVLAVFEEADFKDGGRYLGQFTVVGVDEANNQVAIQPCLGISEQQGKQLAASKGNWSLWEIIPIDNHELFSDWTEEQKKAVFPEGNVLEYIKDGQPAKPDDLEQWGIDGEVVDGKYVRQLRDYDVLLKSQHRKLSELAIQIAAATQNNQALQTAQADARVQVQFRQNEITALKAELAQVKRQRDAVVAHLNALNEQLAAAGEAIDKTIEANQVTAAQIAKAQLEASRRIDERTAALAHSSQGR